MGYVKCKPPLTAAERRADIRRQKAEDPLRWYFLSFANDVQFLGGAFVQAHGEESAIDRAHRLYLPRCKCEALGVESQQKGRVAHSGRPA